MTTSPAPTPELRLLVDNVDFGEGPRWHDGRLWYSDFYQRAIYAVTTAGDGRCCRDDQGSNHDDGLEVHMPRWRRRKRCRE